MTIKTIAAAAFGAAAIACAAPAGAQGGAPPPLGYWATQDGGERFLATAQGECSLANGQGQIITSGSCSWNPSSRGGILTIMSNQLYRPAPIYYNVIWVNENTITIEGDVFYKQR